MPCHSAAGCGAWRWSWLLPRREWALPRGLHPPTRILGCFRSVAEVGGHRIDVALKPLLGVANDLAKKNGWFLTRQFENEANADYHSRTTAREIVNDFNGERLDYWVTGFGTGGTLKGVGRVLEKERPEVKIILAEPADAPMVSSKTAQERNRDGSPASRHPAWKPHPIQGWSPDFIPKLTGDAVEMSLVDRVITIPGPVAIKASQELARKEGIFVGISAGATFAAALEVANGAPKGTTILAMLPDTGERYLSTPLFADIQAEMNEEETALAKSV